MAIGVSGDGDGVVGRVYQKREVRALIFVTVDKANGACDCVRNAGRTSDS